MPALVVVGDKDRSSAAKQAFILVQELESVRLCVVKHAGHSPMCENPAAFNRLLVDFLGFRDEPPNL
jgi:3-oxoadipate enol-lactonase